MNAIPEDVPRGLDSAAEVYTRTGNPDAPATAVHIRSLIEPAA